MTDFVRCQCCERLVSHVYEFKDSDTLLVTRWCEVHAVSEEAEMKAAGWRMNRVVALGEGYGVDGSGYIRRIEQATPSADPFAEPWR